MYEYKVVSAPLRTVKVKGLKTTEERFAHLIEEALNDEAADGWEYLRAETLPCEERKGLTGTTRSFQSLLVFRRPRMPGASTDADSAEEANAPSAPVIPLTTAHQTAGQTASQSASQPHARQEPLFRAGAALRAETPRPEPVLRAGNGEPAAPGEADEQPADDGKRD